MHSIPPTAVHRSVQDWTTLATFLMGRVPKDVIFFDTIIRALHFGADCHRDWHQITRWALSEFHWLKQGRDLTAEEREIEVIAEKLYDACEKVEPCDSYQ